MKKAFQKLLVPADLLDLSIRHTYFTAFLDQWRLRGRLGRKILKIILHPEGVKIHFFNLFYFNLFYVTRNLDNTDKDNTEFG